MQVFLQRHGCMRAMLRGRLVEFETRKILITPLGFRGLGFRGLGGLGFRGLGFRGLGFRV